MRTFFCLGLLALFALTEGQAATIPGAAVFVRATSAADDAPSDVYEQPLSSGRARRLVSHTALPKSFRGRILRALPSPDGSALLLVESDWAIVKNTRSGRTRRVLDPYGYTSHGDEEEVEEADGGYWLWSRRAGTVKRIAQPDLGHDLSFLRWSPRGEKLVMVVNDDHAASLLVFDVATGATRRVLTVKGELLFARWTPDGAALLLGELLSDGTSRLELVSLTGKRQVLLTRPTRFALSLVTAAMSPNGRMVAIGDRDGFSLRDRSHGARRRLRLSLTADWARQDEFAPWPEGDAVFSSDGSTLVVLASSESGPGHLVWEEELWVARTRTAAVKRLARWGESTNDSDSAHTLLGWVPGQSALFVMSEPHEKVSLATEWRKLWLQPLTPGRPARLLVNTGPLGIDLSWWGPSSPAPVRASTGGL